MNESERRRAITAELTPVLNAWGVPDAERRDYFMDLSAMSAAKGFKAALAWVGQLREDMGLVR